MKKILLLLIFTIVLGFTMSCKPNTIFEEIVDEATAHWDTENQTWDNALWGE